MADSNKLISHVTCGQSKKLISVDDVSELRDGIIKSFQLQGANFIIQKWDSDFTDWVDIDISSLHGCNKCKLQVVFRSADEDVSVVPSAKQHSMSHSSWDTIDARSTASAASSASSTLVVAQPQFNTVTQQRHLPQPYVFPRHNIRDCVAAAILNSQNLRVGQRSEMMEAIYQDVSKYTLYPSPGEWTAIVDALFDSFPSLRSEAVGFDDVQLKSLGQVFQLLWRSRLMRYFQNARSRRDNTLQVVLARKRKPGSTISAGTCAKRTSSSFSLFGVVNYLPSRPDGETDDTIADMIQLMNEESRKLKKNRSRVDDLMNQTFADRRKSIVTDVVSLSELKQQFPCLFSQEQLFAEFSRLTNQNIVDRMQHMLDTNGSGLVDMAENTSKPKPALLQEKLAAVSRASVAQKRDCMWAAAVLCLPYVLGDDITTIIGNEESTEYPVYLVNEEGSVSLFVDGINVTTCDNLPIAITLYFVCFYVFNLSFCRNSAKTMLFVQRYGLAIEEKSSDQFIQRCVRVCASVMEKLSCSPENKDDTGDKRSTIQSEAFASISTKCSKKKASKISTQSSDKRPMLQSEAFASGSTKCSKKKASKVSTQSSDSIVADETQSSTLKARKSRKQQKKAYRDFVVYK